MDMYARNQYLEELKKEYLNTSKQEKSRLLDEAGKRTQLTRKYLIFRLKPSNNLKVKPRRKRKEIYDGQVRATLVKLWEIFDYPCGQRLKPLLETEVDRLRGLGELSCSDEVAEKLKHVSPRTIDTKLKHQKELEFLKRKYHRKIHPLLYQKIPVKVAGEQDRTKSGNIQIDLIEHCGNSTRGEYLHTLSSADISSGWWEGKAVMGRGQERVFQGLKEVRERYPFVWREIHSDNDTAFINWHLFRYCEREGVGFSRSRPDKKNDNFLVEEKNWTHVKKFVGYLRYDTGEEQAILDDLYRRELRLYKNFFQPVIKLVYKERIGGKTKRRYDKVRTPYQRVIESEAISLETKEELKRLYQSLNPAQLKRSIDIKLNHLYRTYQNKNRLFQVKPEKRLQPTTVSFLIAQPAPTWVR